MNLHYDIEPADQALMAIMRYSYLSGRQAIIASLVVVIISPVPRASYLRFCNIALGDSSASQRAVLLSMKPIGFNLEGAMANLTSEIESADELVWQDFIPNQF